MGVQGSFVRAGTASSARRLSTLARMCVIRLHAPRHECGCQPLYSIKGEAGAIPLLHDARCPILKHIAVFRAKWLLHTWNTKALPFAVATLSSVFKFLIHADLSTELWLHASSDEILI